MSNDKQPVPQMIPPRDDSTRIGRNLPPPTNVRPVPPPAPPKK